MSRSYKKYPILKYAGNKDYKKRFNRKLRRTTNIEDIPDGNAYKKMNESWEINDIIDRCSWEEYKKWYPDNKNEIDLYRQWYKTYKVK